MAKRCSEFANLIMVRIVVLTLSAWAKLLDEEPSLLNMSPLPEANDQSVRQHKTLGELFDATPVPDSLEGFELKDAETISEVWPEGTDKAKEVRHVTWKMVLPWLTLRTDASTILVHQIPRRAVQASLTIDGRCPGRSEKGQDPRVSYRSESRCWRLQLANESVLGRGSHLW